MLYLLACHWFHAIIRLLLKHVFLLLIREKYKGRKKKPIWKCNQPVHKRKDVNEDGLLLCCSHSVTYSPTGVELSLCCQDSIVNIFLFFFSRFNLWKTFVLWCLILGLICFTFNPLSLLLFVSFMKSNFQSIFISSDSSIVSLRMITTIKSCKCDGRGVKTE